MLVIKKGQLNRFAVTATELKGVEGNEFLFRFIHQQTFQEQLLILVGVTSTRYTLFELTEGVGEDISLTFGSYSYTVYASDGNLSTTGKPILEVGLMIVPKEEEIFNSFTATKDTQVYGIEIPVIQS